MGGRATILNFVIFVVWSALIAGVWLVAWSRKYCLGSAEIVSFVCLILFKDGGHRVGDTGLVQDFIFLFLLINGMSRRDEFKIPLRDPRDGRILFRSSTGC